MWTPYLFMLQLLPRLRLLGKHRALLGTVWQVPVSSPLPAGKLKRHTESCQVHTVSSRVWPPEALKWLIVKQEYVFSLFWLLIYGPSCESHWTVSVRRGVQQQLAVIFSAS